MKTITVRHLFREDEANCRGGIWRLKCSKKDTVILLRSLIDVSVCVIFLSGGYVIRIYFVTANGLERAVAGCDWRTVYRRILHW